MRSILLTLLALAGVSLNTWPLSGSSVFTGTVTDASGSVVVGAHVEATQLETNFRTTGTSNTEGIYRIQSLQPGPYQIRVSANGFRPLVRQGLTLRVGEVLAVNAQLQLGALQETVQVIDVAASPVETETSSTATVMKGDYLHDLPIFPALHRVHAEFHSGMSSGGYTFAQNLAGFHLAGQRSSAVAYYEDGVIAQGADNGTVPIRSVQNGVAEVPVITTTPKAEYGHAGGGSIQVVKKTGGSPSTAAH